MITDGQSAERPPTSGDDLGDTTYHTSSRFSIDDASDQWLLQTPAGAIFGPVPRSELDDWEREGRVSAACLVRRNDQNHWQSALVLFPHLPRETDQSPGTAPPPRDPRAHVGTTRRVVAPSRRRQNNGAAVFAMGILGMILIGIPIFAMIAWAMGASEMSAINRGEANTEGRWMVDFGYWLGIIGTVIGVAICVGCCVLFRGI